MGILIQTLSLSDKKYFHFQGSLGIWCPPPARLFFLQYTLCFAWNEIFPNRRYSFPLGRKESGRRGKGVPQNRRSRNNMRICQESEMVYQKSNDMMISGDLFIFIIIVCFFERFT